MGSLSDDNSDSGSSLIPDKALLLIDKAFNSAIDEAQRTQGVLSTDDARPAKRRRTSPTASNSGGGFLLDANSYDAGGFVVESSDGLVPDGESVNHSESDDERRSLHETHAHIPLSLIPRALQILDLDPSDSQTLAVFANASERPSRSNTKAWSRDAAGELEDVVSRNDFQAVCAALLPGEPRGAIVDIVESVERTDQQRRRSGRKRRNVSSTLRSEMPETPTSILDDDNSDAQDLDMDESGSSEDDYVPEETKKGRFKGRTRGRTTKQIGAHDHISRSARGTEGKLTERQERGTLAAFSLFFPSLRVGDGLGNDTEEGEAKEALLRGRQLTIKDIANAAGRIKEKLTAEEIIEMLSFFSKTENAQVNPTMNFTEFQEMMMATRLR